MRPSSPSDGRAAVALRSDWKVAQMLAAATYPVAAGELLNWFSAHTHEWAAGVAYRFALINEDEFIGLADLDHVTDSECELGFWLGTPWWGRGFASEAAGRLLEFAFGDLGLASVRAGHAEDNGASERVQLKLGFHPVGHGSAFYRARGQTVPTVTYRLGSEEGSRSSQR